MNIPSLVEKSLIDRAEGEKSKLSNAPDLIEAVHTLKVNEAKSVALLMQLALSINTLKQDVDKLKAQLAKEDAT